MDLFVVPTIGFDLLYAFIIVRLDRRDCPPITRRANPFLMWVNIKPQNDLVLTGEAMMKLDRAVT